MIRMDGIEDQHEDRQGDEQEEEDQLGGGEESGPTNTNPAVIQVVAEVHRELPGPITPGVSIVSCF